MDSEHEDLPVKKCICYNVSFEALLASGLKSLEDIRDEFGCSGGCGMCAKYIELMLETGETSFPILWGPEFKRYRDRRRKLNESS